MTINPRDIDMRTILTVLLFFILARNTLAAAEPIKLIGHFSNHKATDDGDPHIVSGYAVSLYQRDQTVFGDVGVATGSLEPAKGRLFDINFNPTTKRLSFKAKYSTGWEGGKGMGPDGREAREILYFSGTLTRWGLKGTVVLRDGYQPEDAGTRTRENMKRVTENYTPKSYAEWATYAAAEPTW